MQKVRRATTIYFLIQGIAVFAWWAGLYIDPHIREWFVLDTNYTTSLLAFVLADLSFLGIGSMVAAWLVHTRSDLDRIAAWTVTGAMSYAAVYSFTYALMSDRGWLGVILMIPAMIWCGVFAVGLTFGGHMFRASRDGSSGWIIAKTFMQIVVLWSIILGVIPYLLMLVENKLGVEPLSLPYHALIGTAAFILISCVGLWAGYVMSKFGRGTPLPLDHANHLVIRGPYKYVRNPMAVSGIGQGLAVALILGSPLTVLYALMGSLIWQLIFRPLEEDDLEVRFGTAFREYRKNVRCWIPRLTAYQMEGTADSSNSIDSPFGKM